MMNKDIEGLSMKEINGKTIITAPVGAVYLNQFMDQLPIGILNKKETGCGATTVVLENSENVIVACPTRQLIINKVTQYPNERCPYKLLAVKQGVTSLDIEEYIQACDGKQPIKIMVTYDSMPRVFSIVKEHFTDFKVIVDEYQELLEACIYRNKAVRSLLQVLKDQCNVTYLSATPIPYKFRPKELENLPEYEIEWKNTVKIIPYRIQSNSPFALVVNIIKNHKEGHPFKLTGKDVNEYFFYVNSVTAIKHILKMARLSPDEVKIICGKNEINKLKLEDFTFGDATGENKTFTFCTKSAFYGVDFYSEAGLSIIVSDGHVKSSLLDISTDITQIAGRIRNIDNPFKNIILHIYNTGIMCQSKDEFEKWFKDKMQSADITIAAFNNLPPELRCSITDRIRADEPEEFVFYNEEEDKVEKDNLKMAHAQYKFESIDEIYTNGLSLREAYIRAGHNVEESKYMELQIKINVFCGIRNQFKWLYMKYSEERKKSSIGRTYLAQDIEFQDDIVSMAYFYLGDDFVKKLHYDVDKVRIWVHYKSYNTQMALKRILQNNFQKDKVYSLQYIKSKLTQIFQRLRIRVTAKAKLLLEYFTTQKTKVKIENKRVDGYKILDYKFSITD